MPIWPSVNNFCSLFLREAIVSLINRFFPKHPLGTSSCVMSLPLREASPSAHPTIQLLLHNLYNQLLGQVSIFISPWTIRYRTQSLLYANFCSIIPALYQKKRKQVQAKQLWVIRGKGDLANIKLSGDITGKFFISWFPMALWRVIVCAGGILNFLLPPSQSHFEEEE